MHRRKTILSAAAATAFAIAGIGGAITQAQAAPPVTPSSTAPFGLEPFEFVGTADQCGGTAGTDTVTAKWDNTLGIPSPSIFLEKTGQLSNCAAAGVDIIDPSVENHPAGGITELNFDVHGYCGAGAPRFNIQSGVHTAFLGCNSGGTQTPLGNGWTHVEFDQAQILAALAGATYGPILTTDNVDDLYIIFDEIGAANIDNISVNSTATNPRVVGSPTSPSNANECKNGGYANPNFYIGFKNQGDCVSYVATKGKNPPSGPKNPTL